MKKNSNLINIIFGIIFVYCFVKIEKLNYFKHYLDKYTNQLLFLVMIIAIFYFNKYIGTLIFILFMYQYRMSYKEYYINIDPVNQRELLNKIKAQLEFNINKTPLQRSTINRIYSLYFGENEALELAILEEEAESNNPVQ